ncbi:unnamed protein product [Sympodiomycopsis kandeliae]
MGGLAHPLNPYGTRPPDFAALARKYPATFGIHVKQRQAIEGTASATIDFQNPSAVQALTTVLLEDDFGIHADPPNDRLCPPVPNRLNYILWLKDVLLSTRSSLSGASIVDFGSAESQQEHHGLRESQTDFEERGAKRIRRDALPQEPECTPRTLDIGTGSLAIYPLLGCASAPRWDFVATDIDTVSLSHAHKTISDPRNTNAQTVNKTSGWPLRLAERIKLVPRHPDNTLIPIDGPQATLYHAVMCNPPFYTDRSEMEQSLRSKAAPPSAACSGTEGEMITLGGEVAFVTRIIDESMQLQSRVIWYTSMLGKLSSVPTLLQTLRAREIDNYGVTEFIQGQTRRWCLIWGFTQHRLPDEFLQVRNPTLSKLLPGSNTIARDLSPDKYTDIDQVLHTLRVFVSSFGQAAPPMDRVVPEAAYHSGHTRSSLIFLRFAKNVWNRAARRAAKRAQEGESGSQSASIPSSSSAQGPVDTAADPALCLVCTVAESVSSSTGTGSNTGTSAKSDTMQVDLPGRPVLTVILQWTYGNDRADFNSFAAAFLRSIDMH